MPFYMTIAKYTVKICFLFSDYNVITIAESEPYVLLLFQICKS